MPSVEVVHCIKSGHSKNVNGVSDDFGGETIPLTVRIGFDR